MRFNVIRLGVALGLVLFAAAGLAQTRVEEHWSPYDYPKEIPEGQQYHLIVEGDTLWALAGQYFGDPLLWPQLYQANAYIRDPDLIYPGDPLFLNVGTVVTDESVANNTDNTPVDTAADQGQTSGEFAEDDGFTEMEAMQENTGEPEEMEEAPVEEVVTDRSEVTDFELDSSEFVILPAGDRSDMECSTYLFAAKSKKEGDRFDFRVAGGENQYKESFAFDEVLYLNKGRKDGIKPGEVYSVRRFIKDVYLKDPKSPARGKFLGMAVDQMGKVRILAVQDENATAIVTASCQEINLGDFLVPYEQEPIPLITELPVINRWSGFRKDLVGTLIIAEDDLTAIGKGHTAVINLGIERNIAPGDLFIIYRDNPNNSKTIHLPDVYLGHAVALKVTGGSTVIKVIEAYLEMRVGDRVAPLHGDSFLD